MSRDPLDTILPGEPEEESPLDERRLAAAMRSCEGVNWPSSWHEAEHNFDWVARQVARAYDRGEPEP